MTASMEGVEGGGTFEGRSDRYDVAVEHSDKTMMWHSTEEAEEVSALS